MEMTPRLVKAAALKAAGHNAQQPVAAVLQTADGRKVAFSPRRAHGPELVGINADGPSTTLCSHLMVVNDGSRAEHRVVGMVRHFGRRFQRRG